MKTTAASLCLYSCLATLLRASYAQYTGYVSNVHPWLGLVGEEGNLYLNVSFMKIVAAIYSRLS